MVRIASLLSESIADELDFEIGSRIVRINGQPVRDAIDFRFLEAEAAIELELQTASGQPFIYEIEKDPGEGLGIVLAADTVRQCANKCVFCFIDGNPDGARKSLHLKDDDFRLSFTYGSYVTLTNLGPRGFERLIEQRLSPLYVSVHATEPRLRERLLGVPLGGDIMNQLRQLTAAGIQVHTQIVLCPEWNDGAELDRTIDDLWSLGENVLSLSVVPVGLTRYNLDRPVRQLRPEEAQRTIAQMERARSRARIERGIGWVYAGDELFFIANAELPGDAYYDDWPLTENGVGAVRRLVDDFNQGLLTLPRRPGLRIVIVTGRRMQPVFEQLALKAAAAMGASIGVLGVTNEYFGDTVTTAGLLPGDDIADALRNYGAFDVALLPAEALNDDELFIDNFSLEAMRQAFPDQRLIPAFELTSTLSAL